MIIKLKINLFTYISRKDFNVAFLKCNIGTNVFSQVVRVGSNHFLPGQYKSSSHKQGYKN